MPSTAHTPGDVARRGMRFRTKLLIAAILLALALIAPWVFPTLALMSLSGLRTLAVTVLGVLQDLGVLTSP